MMIPYTAFVAKQRKGESELADFAFDFYSFRGGV
jgi:hypothetical protein